MLIVNLQMVHQVFPFPAFGIPVVVFTGNYFFDMARSGFMWMTEGSDIVMLTVLSHQCINLVTPGEGALHWIRPSPASLPMYPLC